MSSHLLESLATTERLAEVFSDASLLQSMLQFEVALARAEARCDVIPADAADHIAAAANADHFDAAAIARAARASGTIAVPFVDALVERVSLRDARAAAFVHRGATSQDVTDTAIVLCVRRAVSMIAVDHDRLINRLRALSDAHADTVMMGRTLLQPAPPITFGLKVAGWLAAVDRSWTRVLDSATDALVLQFGGAAGTLAALGGDGPRVGDALARELDLRNPGAPWHTQRDRLAALVSACGIYTTALGKIARDVTLLMQSEVAEVAEEGGRSSTLPHKRNPSRSAAVIAAATRLPALVAAFLAAAIDEHERGAGGWHAEAPTLVAAVQTTGAAVQAMADASESLRVDTARMRANLAATRGTVYAEHAMMLLVPALSREEAQRAIADALDTAARVGSSFADALAKNAVAAAVLSASELVALDTPTSYLGAAETFRRTLLSGSRK
jgi:3-carboxy-cis,cis-muconate cycloisomerase